eukprot:CAMPEP_0115146280 /NCGR_PEP_ID=MMETSP0227-20121206/62602_1 /TAXON_ID=89957 /ORGANISM="Polarella glacialis, Strain CCMP 1383" /LENGTH=97 /DNA_ID=CAMNT_0002555929 /DNA_START=40 /DNA_END=331 /DNA_ORIENTATION=-
MAGEFVRSVAVEHCPHHVIAVAFYQEPVFTLRTLRQEKLLGKGHLKHSSSHFFNQPGFVGVHGGLGLSNFGALPTAAFGLLHSQSALAMWARTRLLA